MTISHNATLAHWLVFHILTLGYSCAVNGKPFAATLTQHASLKQFPALARVLQQKSSSKPYTRFAVIWSISGTSLMIRDLFIESSHQFIESNKPFYKKSCGPAARAAGTIVFEQGFEISDMSFFIWESVEIWESAGSGLVRIHEKWRTESLEQNNSCSI